MQQAIQMQDKLTVQKAEKTRSQSFMDTTTRAPADMMQVTAKQLKISKQSKEVQPDPVEKFAVKTRTGYVPGMNKQN